MRQFGSHIENAEHVSAQRLVHAAEGAKELNPNAEPLHLENTPYPAADRFALARDMYGPMTGASAWMMVSHEPLA